MTENFFQNFLEWDRELLISLHQSFPAEYVKFLKISSESIVIWCMIFLIGLWLSGTFQKNDTPKKQSMQVFFLIITVFVVYGTIYFFVPQFRPHPGEYLGEMAITPLIPHPLDNSFPSGHSIFSTTFFLATCLYVRKFWISAVTLAFGILTVCSRVLGGVHYPGDIIGGIIFATIAVILLHKVAEKITEICAPTLLKIAKFLKL